MQWINTTQRYGMVAIVFHWVLALLIIILLSVGLYMVRLPTGEGKYMLYAAHKACGFLVLIGMLPRLLWRLMNTVPQLSLPRFEKIIARAVHWLFYVVMFVMPMTGWLMTSAAGKQISFFGWFNVPAIFPVNQVWRHWFGVMHEWLAYGLIAMIVLHVAAALKHYFVDKDDILQRMV